MQRPTVVTVFGILNIVFGGLGLVCAPFSLAFLWMPNQSGNPVARILQENEAYRTYTIGSLAVGMVVAVALIAAGIGLLKMKSWAWWVSIGYGAYCIVAGIVGMVANWVFVLEPLFRESRGRSGPEAAGAVGGAIGGLGGVCIGMAYPILLLVFMNLPNVRAAFRKPSLSPPLPLQQM
ncbi:MAG: hypothetical protein NTX50_09075 [Candidatus Sumerlaeota bacterium]|nr:hypothetical protein [Candidatus Sumerlaeota bacterium]